MQGSIRHLARACGAFALGAVLITFASGCGRGKADVSGEVTVNGKPMPAGIIVFTPEEGAAVATEIVDGKYTATGVPTGNVKVSLDLNGLKQYVDKGTKVGMGGMAGKGGDGAKQKSMTGANAPNLPEGAKEYYAKQAQTNADSGRRTKDAAAMLKDIPEKYADPNTSGWSLTVSRGGNTFDAKVTK